MASRLKDHPSPYLQQHADNPVDWWPWCDDAFAEARRRDVPVFLSIGYSTCHWCHVMAHESFEDDAVATLLNNAFVCIKVDREERPDIDDAYMQFCLAARGTGGWPLTVLLTPDKEPFFAGTYFPKESRGHHMGMLDLVPRVQELWREHREELVAQGRDVTRQLEASGAGGTGPVVGDRAATGVPPQALLDQAVRDLAGRFDDEDGGFGAAPKFPSPHILLFLLRCGRGPEDEGSAEDGSNAEEALRMARRTLDAMAAGGIRDHLGGGFHRYSTDAHWLLPHFEKMLYDQAMHLWAYAEAYHATGHEMYAEVARGVADYILRDLQHPAGGFYSAEDADSEGEEGRFYVWTRHEVEGALAAAGLGDAVALFCDAYDVQEAGNFTDEATGKRTGANVLRRVPDDQAFAARHDLDDATVAARLAEARRILLAHRDARERPLRDEKVLADWNGLAIGALAYAGTVLAERRYVEAAARAAARILERLVDDRGRVRHMMRDDHVQEHGFLDDHAMLLYGLLRLYDATLEPDWLQAAVPIAGTLVRDFQASARDGDRNEGGGDEVGAFYNAPAGGELPRRVDAYDGAMPSGNTMAVWALLRLGRITGDERWQAAAEGSLRALRDTLERYPSGHCGLLCALAAWHGGPAEVVVTGAPDDGATGRLLAAARAPYGPDQVLLRADPALAELAPWTAPYLKREGAWAFVCRDHACREPTQDPETVAALLERKESPQTP